MFRFFSIPNCRFFSSYCVSPGLFYLRIASTTSGLCEHEQSSKMTTNFKKRMISGYSVSHVEEEANENAASSSSANSEAPPLKRLRISRITSFNERNIQSAEDLRNALSSIQSEIEEHGDWIGLEELSAIAETLRNLFLRYKTDSKLSCAVLQAIGAVLSHKLGTSCLRLLRPLFFQIFTQISSITIRSFLIKILHQSAVKHSSKTGFVSHICSLIRSFLSREEIFSQSVLTSACLDLLSDFYAVTSDSGRIVGRLWRKFKNDPSAEVRIAAHRMLEKLTERGLLLEPKTYGSLCSGLEDSNPSVRSLAMNLIFHLSNQSPFHQVPKEQGDSGETMNLVDDVFCKICDRVNDWQTEIRAHAASILGRMENVTVDYVMQTIDKKLMSDLRVKVAGHERQRQLYESGEWSSGRKWADDAPKERLAREAVKLMSIGATGAFVLALEDQFQQVRAAAVLSMAQLAQKYPSFGLTCAEFLVDMFNDEIHDVRLKALQVFPMLGKGVELREDQLEMVLTVLQDASLEIREGLRLILPSIRFSDAKLITMVFHELLQNFNQYPRDHPFICACLSQLGRNNPNLVAENVKSYLNIHPFLQSVEPKTEDQVYIATMSLVCNAVAGESGSGSGAKILDLFTDFHFRHYLLYRYKFPDWFPLIETVGNNRLDKRIHSGTNDYATQTIRSYLGAFRRSVMLAKTYQSLRKSIQIAREAVESVTSQDSELDCLGSWISHQFHLAEYQTDQLESFTNSATSSSSHLSNSTSQHGSSVVNFLRSSFSKHSLEDSLLIRQISLLDRLTIALISGQRAGDLVILSPDILKDVEEVVGALKEQGRNVPGALVDIATGGATSIPYQTLLAFLRSEILIPQLPTASLNIVKCRLILPGDNEDDPCPVVAGTIHRISFEAEISGIDYVSGLFICLTLPDEKRILCFPTKKDARWQNKKMRIKKELAITLTPWMTTAAISIQVGRVGEGAELEAARNYQAVEVGALRQTVMLGNAVNYYVKPAI